MEVMQNAGWVIWDVLFCIFIIIFGAERMTKNGNFRSLGWYIGLLLVLLSAWTLFYMIGVAAGLFLINTVIPLQFLPVSEGIGRYFLNIIQFFWNLRR